MVFELDSTFRKCSHPLRFVKSGFLSEGFDAVKLNDFWMDEKIKIVSFS